MNSISEETIELLKTGDNSAFDIMFKFYYPRLVYFAKEYVYYEVAKGLVQEAFITFLENSPVFSHEAQLRSYLYTLVKNNCLMRLRHEKVKQKYIEKSEAANLQNQIYQSALEQLDTSEVTFKEMESIVLQTINSFPPRCREVFVLSRHDGKKNKEIASCLNISIKAVEAHITNALKILRVALIDFLPILTFLFIGF